MSAASIYYHPSLLAHDTGPGHPESPARLKAVVAALKNPEFAGLAWRDAPKATMEELMLAHMPDYVNSILFSIPAEASDNLEHIDHDTVISSGSGEAALRAAGAVCAAVKASMNGEAKRAFCAVRPPGHHAEADLSAGFCLFNNAAIGALVAQKSCSAKRVAIFDFDVHHGNGTQNMFWNNADLLYVSTHEWPFYPGTGSEDERGSGDNILNVPLSSGTTGTTFRQKVTDNVLPALAHFRPDLLIVSAGFDAHSADPLGELQLGTEDYYWLGKILRAFADEYCEGRMVSVLEGGYNIQALGESVAAYVRASMIDAP